MAIAAFAPKFMANPFENKIQIDARPELIQEVERDSSLDQVLEKCFSQFDGIKIGFYREMRDQVAKMELETLNPTELDIVFNALISKKIKYDNSLLGALGVYMTQLMQTSYHSGHNDFILLTQDAKCRYFGEALEGKEENKLRLKLIGSVGSYLFSDAKNIIVDYCGFAELEIAAMAEDSVFILHEKFGGRLGQASRNCIFKISDKEMYNEAAKQISAMDYSIQLIDARGKILDEKK